MFLMQMNRLEDALSQMKKSGFCWNEALAKIHFLSGDRQKVYDLIPEILSSDLDASMTPIAELYTWLEDYSSTIEGCESAIQSNDACALQPRFQANLAVAYHKTGALTQAELIVDRLIQRSGTSSAGSPEYFLGSYYSWIGKYDSAFLWLEKASKNRSSEMPWLKVDPAFNTLKDDPRYWDLYERSGHKAYDEYLANKKDH
jgi:tetratricopeptide (TPR) repeat protein